MTMISDEKNTEQEAQNQEQTEQTSQQSDSTGSSESTGTSSENDFDSESLEISFGLPPGSLKGVTDEASAMAMIRNHADETLLAGLDVGQEEPAAPAPPATPIVPAAPAAKGKAHATPDGEPAMIERITAEVTAKVTAQFEEKIKSQRLAEVERRLTAEVDSWVSPKYGVTGTRNYNQTKAVRELIYELIPNYVRGANSKGIPTPEPEVIARRLRVHTDDTFKPATRKADATTSGTPGQRKEGSDTNQARSIHARVFNMK